MPDRTPPRTVLEQSIRDLPMTLAEFAEHLEQFARDHHLDGTLSFRHLQRLVTGQRDLVRPATARLLEAVLERPVNELLTPPDMLDEDGKRREFDHVLTSATAIDSCVLDALSLQLHAMRALDRSLGARTVRDDVHRKITQVEDLTHAVALPHRRRALLRLLTELRTLAGWIAFDQADPIAAWRHHNHAQTAAHEAESPAHLAHAFAQQAVILAEAGHADRAVSVAENAISHHTRHVSGHLRAWLEATCGEVLALAGHRDASLRALDDAASTINQPTADQEPYLGLDSAHLSRWRSQALVYLGEPEAVSAVTYALDVHDPTFRRAEVALHIDLARGLARLDPHKAQAELKRAASTCMLVVSPRQRRRAEAVEDRLQARLRC